MLGSVHVGNRPPGVTHHHSVEDLRSCSLMEEWELSHGLTWWGVLGFSDLWGARPFGDGRVAKHGA